MDEGRFALKFQYSRRFLGTRDFKATDENAIDSQGLTSSPAAFVKAA
jgi:hypothetical protein